MLVDLMVALIVDPMGGWIVSHWEIHWVLELVHMMGEHIVFHSEGMMVYHCVMC